MHDRFKRSPHDLASALSLIKEMREAIEWQEDITKALMGAQEKWVVDRRTYERKLERIEAEIKAGEAGYVMRIQDIIRERDDEADAR